MCEMRAKSSIHCEQFYMSTRHTGWLASLCLLQLRTMKGLPRCIFARLGTLCFACSQGGKPDGRDEALQALQIQLAPPKCVLPY